MRISYFFILVFLCPNLLYGQKSLKAANKKWLKAANKKESSIVIDNLYFNKACIFYPKGEEGIKVYEKFNEPFVSLAEHLVKIKKIKTLHAVENKIGNFLEIATIKSKNKNNFSSITAWHKDQGKLRKEVHLVYPISIDYFKSAKSGIYDSNIDQARKLWVDFSNSHRPTKLLKVLYTKDALYFNQGVLYKGAKEIDEKYSYMSNKNWKIKLYADKVLQISKDKALEIGHYVSNGKGHYIIVWKKDTEGNWKVEFDFNF